MPTESKARFRYVVPRPRAGMALRALASGLCTLILASISLAESLDREHLPAAIALFGAATFALITVRCLRQVGARTAPLIIDEHGLEVDDGAGSRWRVGWSELEEVRLERKGLRRQVVLSVRGDPPRARELPRVCQEDLPVEWLAGMIEAFRHRALHR